MNNFKKQFKQGDDYCDIRADYRSLISIGKSVEETEDLLLRAYCPKEGDLLFTPTFWLSLGICEWETGRLTPRTKEEALYCLSLYQETVEQRLNAGPNERLSDMLQFFRETQEMLLSPLPEAKKISKPYARKCPWREGSLLAYQILSPDMKNHRTIRSMFSYVWSISGGNQLYGLLRRSAMMKPCALAYTVGGVIKYRMPLL